MTVDLKNHGLLVSLIALPLFFAVISFTHAKSTHHHKSPSKTGVIVGGTVGGAGAIGGAAKASQSMSKASKEANNLMDTLDEAGRNF